MEYSKIKSEEEITLTQILRIFIRRKNIFIITFSLLFGVQFLNTLYKRIYNPSYLGTFTLLISDPLDSKDANKIGNDLIEDLARNKTDNDIPTLIELLKSPLIVNEIREKYNLSLEEFTQRLQIKSGGGERRDKVAKGILKVSYIGESPEKDKNLLQDLSEAYLKTALVQRQQRLTDGLEFLNRQAPELEKKTSLLQAELALFRRENSFIEPSAAGSAIKELEKDYIVQTMRLETEKARLEKVLTEMQEGNLDILGFSDVSEENGNQNNGITVGISDQSLLKEILGVKKELAKARSMYQPQSKMVKSLEAKLKQLEPIFFENQIKTIKTAIKLNEGSIKKSNEQRNTLKDSFLRQPDLIKKYENLQQKLNIAQENLSGLISARETFQLEMAQQSFPWRIINKPTINPDPILPNVPKDLFVAIFSGFVVAVIASLIKERSDYVFHDSQEVEEVLKIPLLTTMPYVDSLNLSTKNLSKFSLLDILDDFNNKDINDQSDDKYQRFFYQEALRSLYTSIKFSGADNQFKTLAITSSIPSEGKSLINILFAKTLAETGKRVLLIDADLRKPQLHKRLGLDNILGFSSLITDSNLNLENVITKIEKVPNLSVMTSGIRPPDPTLLLNSKRISEIIKLINDGDDFDFVIFDAPPLLGMSDASLISDLVDGIILIVTLNKVDKSLPKEAFKLISSTKSVKLGVIANAVNELSSGNFLSRGYSNYSYKYGYADISSYVDDENKKEENLNKVQSAKKIVSDYLKILKNNILKLFS